MVLFAYKLLEINTYIEYYSGQLCERKIVMFNKLFGIHLFQILLFYQTYTITSN